MEQTTSYETAMQWAATLGLAPAVAHAWFPEAKFITATKGENSLSLTRTSDGCYGIGLGENPWINPEWTKFSLPKDFDRNQTSQFTLQGQWAAYSLTPYEISGLTPLEILPGQRDEEIKKFLEDMHQNPQFFPATQKYIGGAEL